MKRQRTDFIIIHCSRDKARHTFVDAEEINRRHVLQQKFKIGYHYVILRNGQVEHGREETERGLHAKTRECNYNLNSIGICLVGGLAPDGRPCDNFSEAQRDALRLLLYDLCGRYPEAKVKTHWELDPDREDCCPVIKAEEILKIMRDHDEGNTNGIDRT